jgi:hypothetical protein
MNIKPTTQTIQERFNEYDHCHPEVYKYLVSLCFELKSKRFRRYGIRSLWERVRWHFQVEKEMGEDFKLNDHFHSRYVRKIIAEYPEFDGFFELRKLRA